MCREVASYLICQGHSTYLILLREPHAEDLRVGFGGTELKEMWHGLPVRNLRNTAGKCWKLEINDHQDKHIRIGHTIKMCILHSMINDCMEIRQWFHEFYM